MKRLLASPKDLRAAKHRRDEDVEMADKDEKSDIDAESNQDEDDLMAFLRASLPGNKLDYSQKRIMQQWTAKFKPDQDKYPLQRWTAQDLPRYIYNCDIDQKFVDQAFAAWENKLTGAQIAMMTPKQLVTKLLMVSREDAEELWEKLDIYKRKEVPTEPSIVDPDIFDPPLNPVVVPIPMLPREAQVHEEIQNVDSDMDYKLRQTKYMQRMLTRGDVKMDHEPAFNCLAFSGSRRAVQELKAYVLRQIDHVMKQKKIVPKQSFAEMVFARGEIDLNTNVYGLVKAIVEQVSTGLTKNTEVIKHLVQTFFNIQHLWKFRPADWRTRSEECRKTWEFINNVFLLGNNLMLQSMEKTSSMGSGMHTMNCEFMGVMTALNEEKVEDIEYKVLENVMKEAMQHVKTPHDELKEELNKSIALIKEKTVEFVNDIVAPNLEHLIQDMNEIKSLDSVNDKLADISADIQEAVAYFMHELRLSTVEIDQKALSAIELSERHEALAALNKPKRALMEHYKRQFQQMNEQLEDLRTNRTAVSNQIIKTRKLLWNANNLSEKQVTHFIVNIDSSGSVSNGDWETMRAFIIQLMEIFQEINPKNSWSIVQFASNAQIDMRLESDDPVGKMRLMERIIGYTNTAAGLLKVEELLQAGEEELYLPKQIVMTITDGMSNRPGQTKMVINKIKAKWATPKATFIGVGVGKANRAECESLSTSFGNMQKSLTVMVDKFSKLITEVKPEIESRIIEPLKMERTTQTVNQRTSRKVYTNFRVAGFSIFSSEKLFATEVGRKELKEVQLPKLEKMKADLDRQIAAKTKENETRTQEILGILKAMREKDRADLENEAEIKHKEQRDNAASAKKNFEEQRTEIRKILHGLEKSQKDAEDALEDGSWEEKAKGLTFDESELSKRTDKEIQKLRDGRDFRNIEVCRSVEKSVRKLIDLYMTVEGKMLKNKRYIYNKRKSLKTIETACGLNGETLLRFLKKFEGLVTTLSDLSLQATEMKTSLEQAFNQLTRGPVLQLYKSEKRKIKHIKTFMESITKALSIMPECFDAPHREALKQIRQSGVNKIESAGSARNLPIEAE